MKILLISKSFSPKDGPGRHLNEIIRVFQNSGIVVSALTEPALFPLSRFGLMNFLTNIIRARKEAKNFTIIHCMDVWPYGVYGYFAVLGTPKKLFINGIGTYSVLPSRSIVKKFLMRLALQRANRVFCISDYTQKRILEKIKLTNISTVFYGTTELPLPNEEEMENYKKLYETEGRYPILLTVGAIKERKGQFDTLKAAGLLKKQYPNFKYIVAGDDSDKYYVQKIRNYAKENRLDDNYEIISRVDDKTLSFLYLICDIFLLSSNNDRIHFEGWGGVLLEAAQFGKPVIGSRGCGIESAIKDGYNGYLTEQKNPNDIKEKILMAVKNKEQLSKNSKEFCKNFSWDKTVSKYIEFYKL